MTTQDNASLTFRQLGLHDDLLRILDEVGYESPSPIQAQTIPSLLNGKDVIGQAQTGTGKTAAFALPILSRLDMSKTLPQALVLTPTRELAIQVAEAFQKYATCMKGFHVLPIYGGQDYSSQIRALKRGVHVVVGTPGRVMDHMRKGTLKLDGLTNLVLDEADEMLRMGFIDDVEWVLEQAPKPRQIALFSATMPAAIRRIASAHLNSPEQITVKVTTSTAETIRQRYWPVQGVHKLDALTRILEAETFEGMIVFVRTKTATVELAEKLTARGYSSAALNGDISQQLRERTVDKLKKGNIDILVATDVAARGLDVERISHVVNYDIPYDTEAYVHRIGRTGRAGRSGQAILFVAPRERRMLQAIEKATNRKIELMELPSADLINNKRIEQFKQKVTDVLANEDLSLYTSLIARYEEEHDVDTQRIAAALAHMAQGGKSFLLDKKQEQQKPVPDLSVRPAREPAGKREKSRGRAANAHPADAFKPLEKGMERFRLEVGYKHGVKPGNIVGAIANEADIDSKYIGRINILDDYSVIDLPEGMPEDVFKLLKSVNVAGQQLRISHFSEKSGSTAAPVKKKKKFGKLKQKAARKAAES